MSGDTSERLQRVFAAEVARDVDYLVASLSDDEIRRIAAAVTAFQAPTHGPALAVGAAG